MRQMIVQFFNHSMPFNKILGLEVQFNEQDQVQISFPWSDALMGNPVHKILHGGVSAAVLDTMGSLATVLHGLEHITDVQALADFQRRLPDGGTLDLRVDYLRPGKGSHFIASAEVIRKGKKVAVVRSDLHNQDGLHIATSIGSFMI